MQTALWIGMVGTLHETDRQQQVPAYRCRHSNVIWYDSRSAMEWLDSRQEFPAHLTISSQQQHETDVRFSRTDFTVKLRAV